MLLNLKPFCGKVVAASVASCLAPGIRSPSHKNTRQGSMATKNFHGKTKKILWLIDLRFADDICLGMLRSLLGFVREVGLINSDRVQDETQPPDCMHKWGKWMDEEWQVGFYCVLAAISVYILAPLQCCKAFPPHLPAPACRVDPIYGTTWRSMVKPRGLQTRQVLSESRFLTGARPLAATTCSGPLPLPSLSSSLLATTAPSHVA